MTYLEQLIDILEALRDYAEFGQTPQNNELCAELLACAKELIEKITHESHV